MTEVLIIDDDIIMRECLRTAMETALPTLHVNVAPNGRSAFKIFNRLTVDLVITDLIMPEMDGTEFIIKAREKNPQLKIIAYSGGGRVEPHVYLEVARKLGAKYTFPKPFLLEELLEAVKKLLPDIAA